MNWSREIQMLNKNRKFKRTKTYQFKLIVKDKNYDSRKIAEIKVSGREVLLYMWAVMCYGGSTHDRWLSESSHSYMLAFLSVFVLLATEHIFQLLEDKT
jgi:hypothetical protein